MYISPINLHPAKYKGFAKKNQNPAGYNYHITNPMPFDTVSFGKKQNIEEKHKLFDNYNPEIKNFSDYKLPVHNEEIGKRLEKAYDVDKFKKLFDFAQKNGVFDININPKTKFVQTSMIQEGENPLMSKLVWVTDTSNFMPLLKDKHPDLCVPLMENISTYYAKQQRAFDRIINDPLLFEINHDWAGTAKNGVGHVFNPDNNISHKWFARTRLDSMGLYLQSISDLITEGLDEKADYGYKNAKQISDKSIESMANATAYLVKIIYPYAKDTGAWEEKTFNSTASSDVAIINEAFRKVINLMYSPTENEEILKVRERLLNAKNGKVFEDKKLLQNMLKLGEYRIKTNSEAEFPTERRLDGAMSFIFQTEKLDDDVIKNAKKVLTRLKKFETQTSKQKEIVRDNGILRYLNDKYLYLNSDISGKKAEYNPRRKFPPRTEAQWFMVSEISKSYGKIAQSLLDKIEKDRGATPEAKQLLDYSLKKQTEYINRSYARITGKNCYKANGKKCPEYQIPEAYQAVTDSKGEIKFVPGTHTPLTWAQASLYDASKLYLDNIQRYNH